MKQLLSVLAIVLASGLAQPSLTPQQTFEQTEAKTLEALNNLRDQQTEVSNALKALEVEVGNLPALIGRMTQQLAGVRGDFAKVRSSVPSPLSCVKRKDIAFAINGDLSYAVTGNMAFSLNGDVSFALNAVQTTLSRLETARNELDQRLSQFHQSINRLRLAAQNYPAGSERYSRLLASSVAITQASQNQLRLTQQKQTDLAATAQTHRRNAELLYRQGQQTLSQAKGWLEGLDCQS